MVPARKRARVEEYHLPGPGENLMFIFPELSSLSQHQGPATGVPHPARGHELWAWGGWVWTPWGS